MIITLILAMKIDTIKPIKVTPLPFILPKMVVSDSAKVKKAIAAKPYRRVKLIDKDFTFEGKNLEQ